MVEAPWQPRISWQQLLREVFTAWRRRAWVWIGLGALSYFDILAIRELLFLQRTVIGWWLNMAALPCAQTLMVILFSYLGLRYVFGKDRYSASFGSALRMFLPVLLLQVVEFIVSQLLSNSILLQAVRMHVASAEGYVMPLALMVITLVIVLINLLILPFTLLVGPVMLIERRWPIAAIKRGLLLIAGRVSRYIVVLYVLFFSPLVIFAFVVPFLPPMDVMGWSLIVNGIVYLLVNPWLMIASVVLYRDLLLIHYRHPNEVEEWAVEPLEPSDFNEEETKLLQ